MRNSNLIKLTYFSFLIAISIRVNSKPDWRINPASFEYSMSLTGTALIHCSYLSGGNDMIAAFINGEIRGVQSFSWEFNHKPLSYLTIYDNQYSGNEVSFKVYKSSTNEVFDLDRKIVFEENKVFGNDSSPFEFSINSSNYKLNTNEHIISIHQNINDTLLSLTLLNDKTESISSQWSIENGNFKDYFSIQSNQIILLKSLKEINVDTIHLEINAMWQDCSKLFHLSFIIHKSTGTKNHSISDIILFPNPSSAELFIRNLNVNEVQQIRIIKLDGQSIEIENYGSEQNSLHVPISQYNLPSGLYKILIDGTKGSILSKSFVIKKE